MVDSIHCRFIEEKVLSYKISLHGCVGFQIIDTQCNVLYVLSETLLG